MENDHYILAGEEPRVSQREGIAVVSEAPFKRSWTDPYPGILSYFFRSVAPSDNAQGQLMLEWVKYRDLRPYIRAQTDETGTIAGKKGDIIGFEIKKGYLNSYMKKREVLKQRFPVDFAHDSIKKRMF